MNVTEGPRAEWLNRTQAVLRASEEESMGQSALGCLTSESLPDQQTSQAATIHGEEPVCHQAIPDQRETKSMADKIVQTWKSCGFEVKVITPLPSKV